jgi:hypothetical protein
MKRKTCTKCAYEYFQPAKILRNNSKRAVEYLQWKIGGRTAAIFGENGQKNGRKKFVCEKLF